VVYADFRYHKRLDSRPYKPVADLNTRFITH
jgi:hypothetical protein